MEETKKLQLEDFTEKEKGIVAIFAKNETAVILNNSYIFQLKKYDTFIFESLLEFKIQDFNENYIYRF